MQDYLRVEETKTYVPEAALRWGDDVTDAGLPVGDDRSPEDCLEWARSIRNMYSPDKPSGEKLQRSGLPRIQASMYRCESACATPLSVSSDMTETGQIEMTVWMLTYVSKRSLLPKIGKPTINSRKFKTNPIQ